MGLFSSPRKRRRSPGAVLRSLQAKIAKKQKAIDKKRNIAKTRSAIEAARKKLRGY